MALFNACPALGLGSWARALAFSSSIVEGLLAFSDKLSHITHLYDCFGVEESQLASLFLSP